MPTRGAGEHHLSLVPPKGAERDDHQAVSICETSPLVKCPSPDLCSRYVSREHSKMAPKPDDLQLVAILGEDTPIYGFVHEWHRLRIPWLFVFAVVCKNMSLIFDLFFVTFWLA